MQKATDALQNLSTEQLNEATSRIDTLSPLEIVTLMNEQDACIAAAVKQALPQIAKAVEGIVSRIRQGGRLFYIGAGTSGRLGVLDASECPPTFNVSNDLVIGVIAGGDGALRLSSESAEDSPEGGARDLSAYQLTDLDTVVAVSASGYAPYCVGALEFARAKGALCVALCCNTNATLSKYASIAIEMPTGSEVVSGSTRLKAGTATKMALNMLSTATMIRLGKTYGNMMVDVRATNAKLKERAVRLTMNAVPCDRERAQRALQNADGSVKIAIVMERLGLDLRGALDALSAHGDSVRSVLETYHQK